MGIKKVFGFNKRKINLIFYKSAPPPKNNYQVKMAETSALAKNSSGIVILNERSFFNR
jgi:hypothetical protein